MDPLLLGEGGREGRGRGAAGKGKEGGGRRAAAKGFGLTTQKRWIPYVFVLFIALMMVMVSQLCTYVILSNSMLRILTCMTTTF